MMVVTMFYMVLKPVVTVQLMAVLGQVMTVACIGGIMIVMV
jgi:hypothetical protein